ncbi:MAG: EamA family transporter [Thomasclavelia sp.]
MWIVYAFGSAFFAGITAILAKMGIQKTDSNLATALRTIVVFFFAWLMALLAGSINQISSIAPTTLLFLILSGLATGASWLFYFKALQIGNINQVVAIDKTSIVLTIILSFIFFQETVTIYKLLGMVMIVAGTYLMLEKRENTNTTYKNSWFIYAVLSVIFASLTTILGKIGISEIESNLGTAIRTSIVLLMAWLVVLVERKQLTISDIPKKEFFFIALSGIATGSSWLCFYRALQIGPASLITPIDKLSIVVTVIFSYFVFGEKISKKAFSGLIFIVIGTLVMLI